MTQPEAQALATKRWGETAVAAVDRYTGLCVVHSDLSGHGMTKCWATSGQGETWEAAFENADARTRRDYDPTHPAFGALLGLPDAAPIPPRRPR